VLLNIYNAVHTKVKSAEERQSVRQDKYVKKNLK